MKEESLLSHGQYGSVQELRRRKMASGLLLDDETKLNASGELPPASPAW
jgi:hypothetical protein